MISLRTFTIVVMMTFMFSQASFFGESDFFSLIFLIASALIIFNATVKLQVGNKRALRANAKKNSFLYKFLSKDKTIAIMVVSFIVSFGFAAMLTMILKGIIIGHGYWTLFILITIISFTIFKFLNKETTANELVNENIQADMAKHANEMLYIFLVAMILNAVLSLLLSAHDTMVILNNKVTFENFDEFAAENQVFKNCDAGGDCSNEYTRKMINLYIILDYFKLAVTNTIMMVFVPTLEQRNEYYFPFYMIIFVLNMMKLFAFSMSFVLMQKGMETGLSKGVIKANQLIVILQDKYKRYIELKEKAEKKKAREKKKALKEKVVIKTLDKSIDRLDNRKTKKANKKGSKENVKKSVSSKVMDNKNEEDL